jgi:pimeloyl-ACP methyl ester carboxylesterase
LILHTEVLGEGEPIVFLHTGLQTGTTDFENQRDYFKPRYKIVLPDLRGHGKSLSSEFTNFLMDSANDLVETLNHLGIGSTHLVGCSLGALVALFFAKNHPGHVKTLTLSGVMPKKPINWLEIHNQEVEHQIELLRDEKVGQYFDHLHNEGWREFIYMARNPDWYPFAVTENIREIEKPILFIVGEGNVSETKGVLIYPEMKSHVHVSVIPFASHLVQDQQPEIYNRILDGFLSRYA